MTKDVKISLAAIPLVAQGDHELRIDLSVPDSDDALFLLELTSVIGLGGVVGLVMQDIPLIKGILDTIRTRTVSGRILPIASGWVFSD